MPNRIRVRVPDDRGVGPLAPPTRARVCLLRAPAGSASPSSPFPAAPHPAPTPWHGASRWGIVGVTGCQLMREVPGARGTVLRMGVCAAYAPTLVGAQRLSLESVAA